MITPNAIPKDSQTFASKVIIGGLDKKIVNSEIVNKFFDECSRIREKPRNIQYHA